MKLRKRLFRCMGCDDELCLMCRDDDLYVCPYFNAGDLWSRFMAALAAPQVICDEFRCDTCCVLDCQARFAAAFPCAHYKASGRNSNEIA